MLTGKRKHPPCNTGIPVCTPPKLPFNGIPRTPPLGSLVDYGDNMVGTENIVPSQAQTLGCASPIPSGFIAVGFPPSPGPQGHGRGRVQGRSPPRARALRTGR